MPTTTLPLGSISKRFFASFIDGIILAIAESVLSWVYFRYFFTEKLLSAMLLSSMKGIQAPEETMMDMMSGMWIIYGVSLLVSWFYFALMESRSGATIGKKMMNLQVTDEEGGPISFGKASVRYFSKILSGALLCVGYIMAFFTQNRQALHDLIARTFVLDGMQTFVSSYARPDISAMHFSGQVPNDGSEEEPYIDLNKDPLEHLANNLNDPRLHTFGSVDLPVESNVTPPIVPIVREPEPTGPVDNSFGDVPPEQTFIDPAVTALKPPTPTPVPVVKKSVAPPAAPQPAAVAPPPATEQAATAPPKVSTSPTGKSCPSCGAPVGQYQTKCMKCKADLQPGGIGKKLFGKF